MIPIKKEPDDILERCHFCSMPTITWHENTNNPVCEKCAKVHKVSELPDFGQTIRRNKRRNRGGI